jgi:hypothetical protein
MKPLTVDQVPTFEEWIDSTSYSSERKKFLSSLWEDCGRAPTRKQLRRVKCFVKDETYPSFKYPRGIYSRSDYAKCAFGPSVAAVNAQLFGLPWFIKKVPVVDRPMAIYERLYKPGAEYAFTDYTSFESHFKAAIQDAAENQLFRYLFKNLPDHYKNILIMETVKGKNQILEFKLLTMLTQAFRCSGEMDTSTSNGFANLMLWLFTSFQAGCSLDDITGYVEGDDGLFRNDGPYPTTEDFIELGFTIKIGKTKNLCEASFCGQVYDLEDMAVVTDIREQICRLGWTNKKYVRASAPLLKELLRARGFSLLYQYTNCPVLGPLGHKILELTENVVIRQSIIDEMCQWDREKIVTSMTNPRPLPNIGSNTRHLVEKLYGVDILQQHNMEEAIRHCELGKALPFYIDDLPGDWIDYYQRFGSDDQFNCPLNFENPSAVVRDLEKIGLSTGKFHLSGVG